MRKVLLDSAVVSYWWMGKEEFKIAICRLELELADAASVPYISAVSIQELSVACREEYLWDQWLTWIRERFVVLPFCEHHAVCAARLQKKVGTPGAGTKSERREFKDMWFRDAAIVGTAMADRFHLVVSSDKRFRAYREHFRGEIRIVEPGIRDLPTGV